MKKEHIIEAEELLRARLHELRSMPYSELVKLVDTADVIEVVGKSGKGYQIEVNAHWDDKTLGRLMIGGSIDDGGFRAYINWPPLLQSFFAYPDGKTE